MIFQICALILVIDFSFLVYCVGQWIANSSHEWPDKTLYTEKAYNAERKARRAGQQVIIAKNETLRERSRANYHKNRCRVLRKQIWDMGNYVQEIE